MERAGLIHMRTTHPEYVDPQPGAEQGDVEYEITCDSRVRLSPSVIAAT